MLMVVHNTKCLNLYNQGFGCLVLVAAELEEQVVAVADLAGQATTNPPVTEDRLQELEPELCVPIQPSVVETIVSTTIVLHC